MLHFAMLRALRTLVPRQEPFKSLDYKIDFHFHFHFESKIIIIIKKRNVIFAISPNFRRGAQHIICRRIRNFLISIFNLKLRKLEKSASKSVNLPACLPALLA